MMIRQIIKIDEDKCNGCGACATACHEGAIDMVDGKAKLVRENFCDGLGDCLPQCPTGAITFENREAPEYDEEAVKENQKKLKEEGKNMGEKTKSFQGGCPGSMAMSLLRFPTWILSCLRRFLQLPPPYSRRRRPFLSRFRKPPELFL